MLRFLARLLAFLALAGAFAAAVIDGARSIGADALLLTPLGATLAWASPAKFAALRPLVERRLGAFAWDPLMTALLKAPTCAVLAALGLLLIYLSRARQAPIGYSSRRR